MVVTRFVLPPDTTHWTTGQHQSRAGKKWQTCQPFHHGKQNPARNSVHVKKRIHFGSTGIRTFGFRGFKTAAATRLQLPNPVHSDYYPDMIAYPSVSFSEFIFYRHIPWGGSPQLPPIMTTNSVNINALISAPAPRLARALQRLSCASRITAPSSSLAAGHHGPPHAGMAFPLYRNPGRREKSMKHLTWAAM